MDPEFSSVLLHDSTGYDDPSDEIEVIIGTWIDGRGRNRKP